MRYETGGIAGATAAGPESPSKLSDCSRLGTNPDLSWVAGRSWPVSMGDCDAGDARLERASSPDRSAAAAAGSVNADETCDAACSGLPGPRAAVPPRGWNRTGVADVS